MKRLLLVLMFASQCFAAAPYLAFLDITSGPKTGGENGKGAYVCVRGNNFGSSRGTSTITVGGGLVDNYPVWSDPGNSDSHPAPAKACFQLGSSVSTGNVVMTVNGQTSNSLSFTVRTNGTSPDSIWCLSPTGNDANSGHYPNCKATWKSVKDAGFAAGDIVYLLNGYTATAPETGASMVVLLPALAGASSSAPSAFLGAPGATVSLGDATTDIPIVYIGNSAGSGNGAAWWTIANLNITCKMNAHTCVDGGIALSGETESVLVHDIRRVNLLCQAPSGYQVGGGCIGGGEMYNVKDLGNEIKNVGCGFGKTGGIDDSATVVNQAVQNSCPVDNGIGTISSTGTTVTGTYLYTYGPGTHICSPDCSNPVNEKIIVSNSSNTQATVNSAWSVDLSNASYKVITKTASKFLHAYYQGGTSHDYEIGWNYIHNNSNNNGMQVHAQPNNQSFVQLTSTTAHGAGAVTVVLPSAFDLPVWQSGDRVDFTINIPGTADATIVGQHYISVVDSTHGALYQDAALTIPVTSSNSCVGGSCGLLIHEGLRAWNMDVHDNRVEYQNGICIAFPTLNPSAGAQGVKFYNNIMGQCGQGPNTTTVGSGMNLFAFETEDVAAAGYYTYGSGTFYFDNNTIYDAGRYAQSPSDVPLNATLYIGAVANSAPDLTMSMSDNIIYHLDASARYFLTTGSATYTGSNNLMYGGSVGAQSGFSGTPTSLQTTPTGNGVSCLSPCSLFTTAGSDYSLASNSVAAYNTGIDTTSIVQRDMNGTIRPQFSIVDIGAYEFSGSGTSSIGLAPGVIVRPGVIIK